MNLESFVTECFQKHLAADLLAVSVRPMAGTMHVRVTVAGRLPEAKAVAEEFDGRTGRTRSQRACECGVGEGGSDWIRAGIFEAAKRKREEFLAGKFICARTLLGDVPGNPLSRSITAARNRLHRRGCVGSSRRSVSLLHR